MCLPYETMELGTKVWELDLEWTHLGLIEPTIRSAAVETQSSFLEFVDGFLRM